MSRQIFLKPRLYGVIQCILEIFSDSKTVNTFYFLISHNTPWPKQRFSYVSVDAYRCWQYSTLYDFTHRHEPSEKVWNNNIKAIKKRRGVFFTRIAHSFGISQVIHSYSIRYIYKKSLWTRQRSLAVMSSTVRGHAIPSLLPSTRKAAPPLPPQPTGNDRRKSIMITRPIAPAVTMAITAVTRPMAFPWRYRHVG